ncbi:MAG: TlpA family protein disulfide reductase [Ktedonobacterales bacterium]
MTNPERERGARQSGAAAVDPRRQWALRVVLVAVIVGSALILLHALLTPAPPPAASATPGTAAPEVAHYAPNVTFSDLAGHPVQLTKWRGSVVVLNFWYVACEPCRLEMPALEREYVANRGAGLVVLGVNTADDASAITSFTSSLGVTYPIVRDPNLQVVTTYRVVATPMSFILDRQGVIRYRVVGPIDRTSLQNDVAALLAQH